MVLRSLILIKATPRVPFVGVGALLAVGSFQAILYVESGGANGPIGNIFLGNEVSFSL